MGEFVPTKSALTRLENKIIVVTGGASGIGAATLRLLCREGAHVFFGDISSSAGESIVSELNSATNKTHSHYGTATFVHTDVSSYSETYALFRSAYNKHHRVDHAIACAGILEKGKWFDAKLDIETVSNEDEESRKVLDTNLYGVCSFARIAVVFLRDSLRLRGVGAGGAGQIEQHGVDKSLTIVASVASIRESAGLFMYQTSKTGILGLLRSMRALIYQRDGVRTNVVCPGMTESAMTTSFINKFREKALATQTSEQVAEILLGVTVQSTSGLVYDNDQPGERAQEPVTMNGRAFYVECGRAFEFEQSLWETMPSWLSNDATTMLKENAEFVASGALLSED